MAGWRRKLKTESAIASDIKVGEINVCDKGAAGITARLKRTGHSVAGEQAVYHAGSAMGSVTATAARTGNDENKTAGTGIGSFCF